jgi:hypothetical protein
MTALRHRCRNPRCRMKLPVPVENEHHAFCSRGCYGSFYRNRCRVCERDLRKAGKRGDAGRVYCRPPANCRQEAARWPEKYSGVPWVGFPETKLRSADSTGLRIGIKGHPSVARHPRGWVGDSGGDLSLYDADDQTVARIVLAEDGRYHLRTPVVIPRQTWPGLDAAKHGAEGIALMAVPLKAVSPKLAASINRDNEASHPMGPPLNRPPLASDVVLSDWKPTGDGADVPPIPEFLLRRSPTPVLMEKAA